MPLDGPFQVKFISAWATPRVGSAEAGGVAGGITMLHLVQLQYRNSMLHLYLWQYRDSMILHQDLL